MSRKQNGAEPASPRPPDDPLKGVIDSMKKSQERAVTLQKLLRITGNTGVALLLSLVANGVQYWRATDVQREYFATDSGRLVRLAPTSEPGWSQEDVLAFGSQTLTRAFNLDFVHYREQVSSLAPRFSEAGYSGYVNALNASNILDALKKERMNLTGTTGAGVIVRQGQFSNGVWFWTAQYPVRLRLIGQNTRRPEQTFTFELTITRVDPRLKPTGMEISQMISRNAPRG